MITLHETEKVLGTYRKTWFVFLFTGLTAFALLVAPLVLYVILRGALFSFLITTSFPFLMLLATLWWWGVWTGTFIAFANYYLDIFIVTDERILNIDQHGPFSRTVAELRLERIQDVVVEQHGLLPTLLHFGTVRVQTAGEAPSFTFHTVPHPSAVKETIMQAHRASLLRQRRDEIGGS